MNEEENWPAKHAKGREWGWEGIGVLDSDVSNVIFERSGTLLASFSTSKKGPLYWSFFRAFSRVLRANSSALDFSCRSD